MNRYKFQPQEVDLHRYPAPKGFVFLAKICLDITTGSFIPTKPPPFPKYNQVLCALNTNQTATKN